MDKLQGQHVQLLLHSTNINEHLLRSGPHWWQPDQQIRKLKNAATAPRQLGSGTTIRTSNYGNLIETLDNRHTLVHTRELYKEKLHITTSFNPSSLNCSNCPDSLHNILEQLDGGRKP